MKNSYIQKFKNTRLYKLFVYIFVFVAKFLHNTKNIYLFYYNKIFHKYFLSLWNFICLIYTNLKKQKWTHIVAPFYSLIYLFFLYTIYYDTKYPSEEKFSMGFCFILFSLYILPKLAIFTFILIILLKITSLKINNINIITSKFMLDNRFYNIYWLINTMLMFYSFCILIVFTFLSLFE